MILAALEKQFAIPVLRDLDEARLEKTARALADGGMNVLEITVMSAGAYDVIRKLARDSNLVIGAGTLKTEGMVKRAIESGAKFLVSPGFDEASLAAAKTAKVTMVPGVLTPSEIMRAENLGLSFVKVFPAASVGGAKYLSQLSGPFPGMKWMATGGITTDDIASYAKVAACVGLGSQLFPKEAAEKGDWKTIAACAEKALRL